ncbi:methanobactin export MATE transporter MbnM [Alteromonas oceanisediminis]|uniref:methanobactin export MATE transporter MbnM n=1 Tax=Alteromonas oceanisediminis TaxID=2836180 RepID=UPI001BD94169|nr:methanobactin export MATE transporter MbnM [Alteromonas oceanisediminis]MBT0585106.1 di-heme enzyme [Alteromonas oceanisediminis]
MAISRILLITLAALFVGACSQPPTPYAWQIPEGFPTPNVPVSNPMTEESVALGRALFFEPALSGNGAVSCSTCHMPAHAFSEPRTHSHGSTGDKVRRNAMALVNVGYNGTLTWAHNGFTTIEQQLMVPLFGEHPVEMGITGNEEAILARFKTDDYRQLFAAAYGDEAATFDRVVKALASFVRSLTSFNSPFDDYAYRQQDDAMSESALRGMELFFSERLECFHCHGGFNFTQSSKHAFQQLDLQPFHNTGLYNLDGEGAYPQEDTGLVEITLNAADMGKFRAPTLRNIELSAPYMHDGSLPSLDAVIAFYAAGGRGEGINSPLKSPFVSGFTLTAEEHQDLKQFLLSLTDEEFVQKRENNAPTLPPKVAL